MVLEPRLTVRRGELSREVSRVLKHDGSEFATSPQDPAYLAQRLVDVWNQHQSKARDSRVKRIRWKVERLRVHYAGLEIGEPLSLSSFGSSFKHARGNVCRQYGPSRSQPPGRRDSLVPGSSADVNHLVSHTDVGQI